MKPKVGLLPLYLKLYDDAMPELRAEFGRFLDTVAGRLRLQELDVKVAPIGRLESEVAPSVHQFESQDVDLIITLHLAYSPSLESASALARTPLPILMLDTTMDYEFSQQTDPARLMYNHGVHGVQDLASMLGRMSKSFDVIAGHVDSVELFVRAARYARGACAAARERRRP